MSFIHVKAKDLILLVHSLLLVMTTGINYYLRMHNNVNIKYFNLTLTFLYPIPKMIFGLTSFALFVEKSKKTNSVSVFSTIANKTTAESFKRNLFSSIILGFFCYVCEFFGNYMIYSFLTIFFVQLFSFGIFLEFFLSYLFFKKTIKRSQIMSLIFLFIFVIILGICGSMGFLLELSQISPITLIMLVLPVILIPLKLNVEKYILDRLYLQPSYLSLVEGCAGIVFDIIFGLAVYAYRGNKTFFLFESFFLNMSNESVIILNLLLFFLVTAFDQFSINNYDSTAVYLCFVSIYSILSVISNGFSNIFYEPTKIETAFTWIISLAFLFTSLVYLEIITFNCKYFKEENKIEIMSRGEEEVKILMKEEEIPISQTIRPSLINLIGKKAPNPY